MIVEVVWKKTVATDLLHCPAPTLTHYDGRYWLFFNAPMPGDLKRRRVMFSHSANGKDWREAKPLTDLSEFTHIGGCFVHDGRLYVLFFIGYVDELQRGSALQRRQPNYIPPYQPMLTWTGDGETWSKPEPCYEQGWWPWRPKGTTMSSIVHSTGPPASTVQIWPDVRCSGLQGEHSGPMFPRSARDGEPMRQNCCS